MNLYGIAKAAVGSINECKPVEVFISTGNAVDDAFVPGPSYATPCAFTGSIAGNVLTVASLVSGVVMKGQTLFDVSSELVANTIITGQLSGTKGGEGTYSVNLNPQTIAPEAMTTKLILQGQIQPMTWRDIQQLDGLTLQGTRKKIYLFGEVDGLVRSKNKGGDLIKDSYGNTWLVAQILEQWYDATPSWVAAAVTLQNGS